MQPKLTLVLQVLLRKKCVTKKNLGKETTARELLMITVLLQLFLPVVLSSPKKNAAPCKQVHLFFKIDENIDHDGYTILRGGKD